MALGGNALRRRGQAATTAAERANVATAVAALADLAVVHELVVTHGNGPQVGLLALQAESVPGVEPYPLDVLGAESEGLIGYLLGQGLLSALPGRQVATLLTQVVVDGADPAFEHPTKPIGPVLDDRAARRLTAERGFAVGPDGDGFRRLVPSPRPLRLLELPTVRLLVDAGVVVICAGGGGIPVVALDGTVRGVEAVVDKDLTAALVAEGVDADGLVLLTDVDGLYRDFAAPGARLVSSTTPAELRGLDLAAGTMGPKAEAAARFVEATGAWAAIGALEQASAVVAGCAGTRVTMTEGSADGV